MTDDDLKDAREVSRRLASSGWPMAAMAELIGEVRKLQTELAEVRAGLTEKEQG
jgi:hypothetical protein